MGTRAFNLEVVEVHSLLHSLMYFEGLLNPGEMRVSHSYGAGMCISLWSRSVKLLGNFWLVRRGKNLYTMHFSLIFYTMNSSLCIRPVRLTHKDTGCLSASCFQYKDAKSSWQTSKKVVNWQQRVVPSTKIGPDLQCNAHAHHSPYSHQRNSDELFQWQGADGVERCFGSFVFKKECFQRCFAASLRQKVLH